MDRKVKKLLKGAGLQRLVGGITGPELYLQRENKEKEDAARLERNKAFQQKKSEADAKAKADEANRKAVMGDLRYYADGKGVQPNGYVTGPPAAPQATVADFAYYMEHGDPSTVAFEKDMFDKAREVLVDRYRNQTPEAFAKTKADTLKRLRNPYMDPPNQTVKKNGTVLLRDQWLASELEKSTFGKSAEKFVAKDTIYRQPLMSADQWAADVQRNIQNWKQRVDDAQLPAAKASLISEFTEYQNQNASYDTYVSRENAKPAPPSFEGKADTEVTKALGEEDVKFDKTAKLNQLRQADDSTSRNVAEKIATLRSMKKNPLADEQIDKALSYIKWGEELREQIALWERAATNKDMTLPDYYDSIGKPPLIDVEGEVARESKEIEDNIERYKKSKEYVFDQIKKWGLLVIDVGSMFLPYVLPFPIGEVISMGYQAFAPEGSIFHTEGSFSDKAMRGVINGATAGLSGLIGMGRNGRRKYMKTLMESEGKASSESSRHTGRGSHNLHALHDKSRSEPRKRKTAGRRT